MQKKNSVVITADGKQMLHDGVLFKRTVLPSAVEPHDSAVEIAEALEALDNTPKEI